MVIVGSTTVIREVKNESRRSFEYEVFLVNLIRPGIGTRTVNQIPGLFLYLISCSKASNSGVEKNSPSVMPRPSQIILIVMSFGF